MNYWAKIDGKYLFVKLNIIFIFSDECSMDSNCIIIYKIRLWLKIHIDFNLYEKFCLKSFSFGWPFKLEDVTLYSNFYSTLKYMNKLIFKKIGCGD